MHILKYLVVTANFLLGVFGLLAGYDAWSNNELFYGQSWHSMLQNTIADFASIGLIVTSLLIFAEGKLLRIVRLSSISVFTVSLVMSCAANILSAYSMQAKIAMVIASIVIAVIAYLNFRINAVSRTS